MKTVTAGRARERRFPYGPMSDEKETVTLMHTCAGNGCDEPVGSSRRQQAWVHEDGSHLCGAGLGVLEEPNRDVEVPVPVRVLEWERREKERAG